MNELSMQSSVNGRSAEPIRPGLGGRKPAPSLKVTILFGLLGAVIYLIYDSYQFRQKTLAEAARINEQIKLMELRDKATEAYISKLKGELSRAQPPPDPTFTPSPMVTFLKVNVGSSWLPANEESHIFSNNIWAPGHANYMRQPLLLPGPATGVFWGVVFTPAPYTVRNTTNGPIDLVWNVYSDNSYVYQGRETIPEQSHRVISFGTMQMGYIYGPNPPGSVGPGRVGPLKPDGAGMSLVIGIYPYADGLIGYWDTQGPTPHMPNAGRVSGGSVTLTPLCQLPTCR